MINSSEFKQLIEEIVQDETEGQPRFRIGTIATIEGKPTIVFAGENEPSGKGYSFLSRYSPRIGDRVLLVRVKGTYVILDRISHVSEEIERGYCGIGGQDWRGSNASFGVGVNFRKRKTYVPSSISFETVNTVNFGLESLSLGTSSITEDGFFFFFSGGDGSGLYRAWRGYYTA